MDDGDVAEDADADVFAGQPFERPRSGRALEELRLVQQLASRRRALKVVGEQLAEALDVAEPDGVEVGLIEIAQQVEVGGGGGHGPSLKYEV